MTHRREVLLHRSQLMEIREIMNSMKNLAYFETRKLNRYIGSQQQVVIHIETVAADLLHHHPALMPGRDTGQAAYLLLGSERGFCGDFNVALLNHLETQLAKGHANTPYVIVVGHKLQQRLEGDTRVTAALPGASAAEEISVVLGQLVDTLLDLQAQHPGLHLQVLYQDPLSRDVIVKTILPPFTELNIKPNDTGPPLLHLSAEEVLHELIEHYLIAVLHGIAYSALMAENQSRIEHLEQAMHRLDEKSEELFRKSNAMRQEEIIEEIEVILLNATPSIQHGRK